MTCVPHTARISNVDSVMFCKWNKKDGPLSHRDSMVSKAPIRSSYMTWVLHTTLISIVDSVMFCK